MRAGEPVEEKNRVFRSLGLRSVGTARYILVQRERIAIG
jgi:hypothetical protein